MKGREKRSQKRGWDNSTWFVNKERNVRNNLVNQVIRKKIVNEGRDEVNDGTIQENDNTGDISNENNDINHADSVNEEPIEITENNERDWLLRLKKALEDNDFVKTEVNLKYGDKEKLMEEVIKMNKVIDHVKITGFTHCRKVIQAAMRFVELKSA